MMERGRAPLTSAARCRGAAWALTLGLAALPSGAQDTYSGMTLEGLLKLKIVTATQTYQTSAETPAVVTVLTADQIRDLGVSTLYEALEFVPGVVVSESYFGYSMVNLRGNLQTHYNNKVLLLIDGHPMREVTNGSFHLEIVPIEAVERIEIIRGPGSVLYGTNAFAGVVNVITRRGPAAQKLEAVAGGGSYDGLEAALSGGRQAGGWELFGAASYRGDDGYPYAVTRDERGNAGQLPYQNHVANALARASKGGWTVTAGYFKQRKAKLGITPVLDYGGVSRYEGVLADVQWQRKLGRRFETLARLRYDNMDRRFDIGSFPFDGFLGHADADVLLTSAGDLFGADGQLRFEPRAGLSLMTGVTYERRHTEPYLFLFQDDGSQHPFTAFRDSASENDLAWFGQALVERGERDQIVLGLRYDHNQNAGSSLAPRLGWVHRFGEATYAKALYGRAYRSPDFFEKKVATYNVLYGDPSLSAENIETYDLVLDTRLGKNVRLQLDGFLLTTSDLIVRRPTPDPVLTGPAAAIYVNAGGDRIRGIEAALDVQLPRGGRASATYAFASGEDRQTQADLANIARHSATLAASWRLAGWLSLKPNLLYLSKRGAAPAQTRINLVAQFPLGAGFDLWVAGRNLTDEDLRVPEYIRDRIPPLPGGAGRSVLVRLSLRR